MVRYWYFDVIEDDKIREIRVCDHLIDYALSLARSDTHMDDMPFSEYELTSCEVEDCECNEFEMGKLVEAIRSGAIRGPKFE